jgi:transcriptional regulator with XRE-family HTH domain
MTRTVHLPARRTPPQSLREYLAGPPAIGQRALAAAVGCNQSMISMLARGTRVPSARLAVKLHAVTGVPLQRLLATRLDPRHKHRRPLARGDPARRYASS